MYIWWTFRSFLFVRALLDLKISGPQNRIKTAFSGLETSDYM